MCEAEDDVGHDARDRPDEVQPEHRRHGRFRCRIAGTENAVISIAVLLLLAAVNLAAGLKYPPLLANVVALVVLTVIAWREMHHQEEPEN